MQYIQKYFDAVGLKSKKPAHVLLQRFIRPIQTKLSLYMYVW